MADILPTASLDQLFNTARTYNGWLDKDVSEEQIHAIYDLMKMAPTSANMQPARTVWCKSAESKARLAQYAMEANKPKISTAPVCAIIGYDIDFHEELPCCSRIPMRKAGLMAMKKAARSGHSAIHLCKVLT